MKTVYCFLLFLTVLVAGCVIGFIGSSTLDQSKAASLTHIHIVPIEGPPLSGTDLSSARLSGAWLVASGPAIGSKP